MVEVFSFCLYGNLPTYCKGMIENIKLINENFPNFEIWIYIKEDVPEVYINEFINKNCKLIPIPEGVGPAFSRFLPLSDDNVNVFFSRDADSRVNDRDTKLIKEFLNSDNFVHIIRDHKYHRNPILAGMWGAKKESLNYFLNNNETWENKIINYTSSLTKQEIIYAGDEKFLREMIYPIVITIPNMIHSSITAYTNENIIFVPPPEDKTDFIGNVYEMNDDNDIEIPKFVHNDYDLMTCLRNLNSLKQYSMAVSFFLNDNKAKNSNEVTEAYVSAYHTNNKEIVDSILSLYEQHTITEEIIYNTDHSVNLQRDTKTIIASFDQHRFPLDNEIVIIYGDYPLVFENLICNNPVRRHFKFFDSINHDIIETDPAWDSIDQIYIINPISRQDRWLDTMRELVKMRAPIHKVKRPIVNKVEEVSEVMYEIGVSHIDAIVDARNNGYRNILVLEDDICFTSSTERNLNDLRTFFERNYDYQVCFLATSRFYTNQLFEHDDLLIRTEQVCTTTAAYIVSSNYYDDVIHIMSQGNQLLKETNDSNHFCIDRYWRRLAVQDRKFFVFKNKMGFQKPSFSNTKKTFSFYLD